VEQKKEPEKEKREIKIERNIERVREKEKGEKILRERMEM
jgi:hypothetical protein